MTHVTSISNVIRVVSHQLTVPLTCQALYSGQQANGTCQPCGTPLKNTFKLVRNS